MTANRIDSVDGRPIIYIDLPHQALLEEGLKNALKEIEAALREQLDAIPQGDGSDLSFVRDVLPASNELSRRIKNALACARGESYVVKEIVNTEVVDTKESAFEQWMQIYDKNPADWKDRFKMTYQSRRLNLQDFAPSIGKAESTLSRKLNGKLGMTREEAETLTKTLLNK